MKIIGIAGTNGAGKDTVSQILADDFGYLFVSASGDLIIPELKKRNLPLERKAMADLTTEWRKAQGMGAVVDKAIEKYQASDQDYPGLVVSSLRHPGEAERVHELGGTVVWVDAEPKVRYERIYRRGQGDKDHKTFEEFCSEEAAEMSHSGDKSTLNMSAVKTMADVYLMNNTDDLDALSRQVKEKLELKDA